MVKLYLTISVGAEREACMTECLFVRLLSMTRPLNPLLSSSQPIAKRPKYSTKEQKPTPNLARFLGDRFIPNRPNTLESVGCRTYKLAPPNSKYSQVLSSTFFGSIGYHKERVLAFSTSPPTLQHPLTASFFRKPLTTNTPKSFKGLLDAPYLTRGILRQPLSISPDNDCLAVALGNEIFLKKGPIISKIAEFSAPVHSLVFDQSGKHLFGMTQDGNLHRMRVNYTSEDMTAEENWTLPLSRPLEEGAENLLAAGKSNIYAGLSDGRILVLQPATRSVLLTGSTSGITGLVFSPNETLLIAANHEGHLYFFCLKNKVLLASCEGHRGAVKAITFSPCGNYFVTAGTEADAKIILWKWSKSQPIKIAEKDPGSPSTNIFWLQDTLVTSHLDGKIRLFPLWQDEETPLGEPESRTVAKNPLIHAAIKPGAQKSDLFLGCPEEEKILCWEIFPYQKKVCAKKKPSILDSLTLR